MKKINEVVLQRIKIEYFDSLKEFELPKEQEQFTALPTKMLEMTHERHPIVIVNEDEPVGFFVLHSSARVKEYTENSHAMLLTALSINHSQQGKGYAKKGMELLNVFVHQEFPACNEIVLAVNNKNIPAQKLYEKVGYKDTARRKIGKLGEQMIFSLSV